jgi:hypothetical protein
MKNIKPYSGDGFSFHEEVIKSKNKRQSDINYLDRLLSLSAPIKKQFDEFKIKFDSNLLEELNSIVIDGNVKEDLESLYNYKSTLLQKLKIALTTDENNRISNTCQNCSIGEINSFDHYLPQSEFAEFVVNPHNLIPSCTKCNSHKSSIWRNTGKREFLNHYLDILPQEQYLFVDITVEDESIELKYYLENKGNINDDLFKLIKSHYNKLNLLERFEENSDSIVSELDTEFNKYSKKLTIDEIKETVIEECTDNKKILGNNNWKIVLKISLVENEYYIKRFIE